MVEVTQEDREAAFPYVSSNSVAGQDIHGWLDGKYDDCGAIQAFARHREATTADLEAQLAEAKAENERLRAIMGDGYLTKNRVVASAAADLNDRFGFIMDDNGDDLDWLDVCRHLRRRIDALTGEPT